MTRRSRFSNTLTVHVCDSGIEDHHKVVILLLTISRDITRYHKMSGGLLLINCIPNPIPAPEPNSHPVQRIPCVWPRQSPLCLCSWSDTTWWWYPVSLDAIMISSCADCADMCWYVLIKLNENNPWHKRPGTRQTHWHIELDLFSTLPAIEATIRWMRLFLCSSVSCGSALSARPSQAMVISHGTLWNIMEHISWISLKVSNIPTNLPTIPNMSQHTFLENGIDTKPSSKAPSHGRTWAVGTALLQRYCWPAQLCLGFWDDKGTTRGNHRTPHDRRNIKQLKSIMEKKTFTLMGILLAKLAKYGEVLKKKGHFLHFKRLLRRMKAWNTNWKVIECHKDPLWVSLWFPLRQGQLESPEVILSMNDSVLASWD